MPLTVRVQTGTLDSSEAAPRRVLLSAARRAVRATLATLQVEDAEISVTLLGDAAIAELNQRWLNHARPTDVLAFPLFSEGEAPTGDVYIGLTQATRQAAELGVPLREEITRLAIHGTLHVLGYDHPAGAQREKSEMWQMQERILARLLSS